MLKNKDQLQDLKSRLDASCGILRLKSETGITNDDLIPLVNAINASEQFANIPTMADTLIKARETYALYKQHAQITKDLEVTTFSCFMTSFNAFIDPPYSCMIPLCFYGPPHTCKYPLYSYHNTMPLTHIISPSPYYNTPSPSHSRTRWPCLSATD